MNFRTVWGLAAVVLVAMAQVCSAQDCCTRPRLISVTGTAEINVAPDEAVLQFGIESRDKTLGGAKSANDERVKRVLALAKGAGVEDKDIKTSALDMGPEYSNEKAPRLLGYSVSQDLSITLRDMTKYESLITSLLEAGVNRVNDVDFRVSEDRKYRDEARAKAIAAAKEKATAMAGELGQRVGKPWEIAEQSANNVFGTQYANSVSGRSGRAAQESTVAPGQVTISATVNVSFQLE